MARPDSSEYAPAYESYISLVPDDDILKAMSTELAKSLAFLAQVSESESTVLHPPYTWTIKQVVGHLTDCERIFGYRAAPIRLPVATRPRCRASTRMRMPGPPFSIVFHSWISHSSSRRSDVHTSSSSET